jgi:hypothetical protein
MDSQLGRPERLYTWLGRGGMEVERWKRGRRGLLYLPDGCDVPVAGDGCTADS